MEPSRPARAPAAAQLSPERVRPPDGSDGGESDDDSGVVVMTLDAFLSAGLDKASLEECPICFELKTDVEMLPHADELAQGQASDGRDVSSHKACATCRASLMKNDEQTCPWCREAVTQLMQPAPPAVLEGEAVARKRVVLACRHVARTVAPCALSQTRNGFGEREWDRLVALVAHAPLLSSGEGSTGAGSAKAEGGGGGGGVSSVQDGWGIEAGFPLSLLPSLVAAPSLALDVQRASDHFDRHVRPLVAPPTNVGAPQCVPLEVIVAFARHATLVCSTPDTPTDLAALEAADDAEGGGAWRASGGEGGLWAEVPGVLRQWELSVEAQAEEEEVSAGGAAAGVDDTEANLIAHQDPEELERQAAVPTHRSCVGEKPQFSSVLSPKAIIVSPPESAEDEFVSAATSNFARRAGGQGGDGAGAQPGGQGHSLPALHCLTTLPSHLGVPAVACYAERGRYDAFRAAVLDCDVSRLGVYVFEFAILTKGVQNIGVLPSTCDAVHGGRVTSSGWSYNANGKKNIPMGPGSTRPTAYGRPYACGDRVVMHVDSIQGGSLGFWLNGETQGSLATGLCKIRPGTVLRPCVDLCSVDGPAKVALIRYVFTPWRPEL